MRLFALLLLVLTGCQSIEARDAVEVKRDGVNVLAMSTAVAPLLPTPGDEPAEVTIEEIDPSGEQLAVAPQLPVAVPNPISTPGATPVRSCPGGVCPVTPRPSTSTPSTWRRRFFLRRW